MNIIQRAALRVLPAGLLARYANAVDTKKWLGAQGGFHSLVPIQFNVIAAAKLTAVQAALNEISWRIACLPLEVYDVAASGDEELANVLDPEVQLVTRRWSAPCPAAWQGRGVRGAWPTEHACVHPADQSRRIHARA